MQLTEAKALFTLSHKVRLSQKTARQRRQSHFSATVRTGFKSEDARSVMPNLQLGTLFGLFLTF